ncbi:uncharacterized protein isoform X2 [Rhodnius prolixus]
MSGDAGDDNLIRQNILNGTTDTELSSLEHVDAPNEGMYMLCGVFIAMVLVALIIILLAVTISKLRKREDSTVVSNNNNSNINHNNTEIRSVAATITTTVPPQQQPAVQPQQMEPPPFLWRYSDYSNSSQLSIATNNDQTRLVHTNLPCEETTECKGFRKNLRGKWRRLVKKKPQQEVYTIPAEIRDQLKQIYVY